MSDRRHELQQNELAAYVGKINRSIEPYSRIIGIVVGALLIGGLAMAFMSTQGSERRSDATLELLGASTSGDTEDLAAISETFPNTAAGRWAIVHRGNELLGEGITSLYSDRESAVEQLGDAREAFQSALSGSKDKLLLSRAHLGLAKTAESLGELDQAIKEYEETIQIAESDQMVEAAEAGIKRLKSKGTGEFLVWFAEQDFAPKSPSDPPALPSLGDIPDEPTLDVPPMVLPGGENSDVMKGENSFDVPDDLNATSESTDEPEATIELPEEAEVTDEAEMKLTEADEEVSETSDNVEKEEPTAPEEAPSQADSASDETDTESE